MTRLTGHRALIVLASVPALLFGSHPMAAQGRHIETASGMRLSEADVDEFIEIQMESLDIPGLSIAIINGTDVVYHRALGIASADSGERVSESSIFEAASLSKPVFAYFVMKMVEKGVLALDTPLHQYLPIRDVGNGWYQGIAGDDRARLLTARMVLSHTTGLPNWRWETPDGRLDIEFSPGTRFSYSGEGYELLADILASLNKTELSGLERLFQEDVADPLGMTHASFVYSDVLSSRKVTGHVGGEPVETNWCCNGRSFVAAGNLHTEASSYAKFLIGLMSDEGLRADLLDEMLSQQVRIPEGHPRRAQDGVSAWGLGIAMTPTDYGIRYTHGGTNTGSESGFMFYRDKRTGYVLFTNSDRGSDLDDRMRALLTEGWGPREEHQSQDSLGRSGLPRQNIRTDNAP